MDTKISFLLLAIIVFIATGGNAQLLFVPPLPAIPPSPILNLYSPLRSVPPMPNPNLKLILPMRTLPTNPNTVLAKNLQTPRVLGIPSNRLGLALLPKVLNGKVPNIPQLSKPAKLPGLKLTPLSSTVFLLNSNPAETSAILPLRIRSADDYVKEDESTDKFLDPVNEETNEEPKIVIQSSVSNATVKNDDHNTKVRSSDDSESMEELDYLAKAANPIDELESKIGSFVKKVGKGFKHTIEKIDTALRPTHSKSDEKDANQFVPYETWSKTSDDLQNQDKKESLNDKMNEYLKIMNISRFQNRDNQMPENLSSTLKDVMDQFQQSLLENAKLNYEKSNNQYYNNDPSKFLKSMENNPVNQFWDSAAKFANNVADTLGPSEKNKNDALDTNQKSNPVDKFWDSASRIADNVVDSVKNADINENKAPGSEQNVPKSQFWDKAIDYASNIAEGVKNFEQNGKNQFVGSVGDGYNFGYYPGYYPNQPVWNSAANMASQIVNAGMNPGYYGNGQMFYPYGYNNGYYQKNNAAPGGVWNSATNFAHNIASLANQGGSYPNINPKVSSNSDLQYPAMYPYLSRNYRQLPQIYGILQPVRIINPDVNNRYLKRNSESDGIWNSATGLADSITKLTSNPSQTGRGQAFGAADSIWNAANNLASNIGKSANSANIKNTQAVGSSIGDKGDQFGNLASPIWNSATDLASAISKASPNPDSSTNLGSLLSKGFNPIGSVTNSANYLADSVSKSALNLGNIAKSHTLGLNNPSQELVKSAVKLASKIANIPLNSGNSASSLLGDTNPSSMMQTPITATDKVINSAVSPTLSESDQMLQSFPTYAGGYYPRSNPASSIWNSANQLAGSIFNTASNPMLTGSKQYYQNPVPFSPIWNSATDLASGISNIAVTPL